MTRRILHIFNQPSGATAQFEQTLEDQGWDSQVVSDCYQGLAQLVVHGPEYFACIILNFEDMATGEEEFFPMALKLAPAAPIYFYGTSAGGVTPETARLHGARGPVDVGVLRSAFGDPAAGRSAGADGPSPPAAGADDAGSATEPPRLSDDELEALLGEDPE